MRLPALRNFPLSLVIIALVLATAVIVGVFGFNLASLLDLKAKESELRLGLFNSIWQFLLITVIGGVVGLFFKTHEADATAQRKFDERKREQRAARRDALLRTRSDLVKVYHEAKAIRRLFRARALNESNGQKLVLREEHYSLMCRLIEAQLTFEDFIDLVESDHSLFPSHSDLKTQLGYVEQYLHGIVKEFETAYEIFGGNDQAQLERFEKLGEFVQKIEKNSRFGVEFKDPFHQALRLIDDIIAEDMFDGRDKV